MQGIIEESADNVAKSMYRTSKTFEAVLQGLETQDDAHLKKIRKKITKFEDEVEALRNHLFYFIKNLDDTSVRGSNFYIMVLANLTDIVQSLEFLAKKSFKHVDNNHSKLGEGQMADLKEIIQALESIEQQLNNDETVDAQIDLHLLLVSLLDEAKINA